MHNIQNKKYYYYYYYYYIDKTFIFINYKHCFIINCKPYTDISIFQFCRKFFLKLEFYHRHDKCTKIWYSVSVKVQYKNTLGIITHHNCNKLNLNYFYRHKLRGCYNSHPKVIYFLLISIYYLIKLFIHGTNIFAILLILDFIFIGAKRQSVFKM